MRLIVILALLGPSSAALAQSPAIHFREVPPSVSGLTGAPHSGKNQRYVVETISGGVALLDCDGDGRLDIAVVNDATLGEARAGGGPMITLYHQENGLRFKDITAQAGLTRQGWGMGITVADYDNDGLPDIYVTGYGGNALYHNLGGCKFEDVTDKASVAGGGFSAGAAWGDYDRDGRLDLFVSCYVHTDIYNLPTAEHPSKSFFHKGLPVENPWSMTGETDFLFHNRGDGTFEEVSKKAGVSDPAHRYGLGVVWADIDGDGWPDLYVANDSGPNFLYRNQHDGTFEETALLSGVALSPEGQELGSMGVDIADFDGDGRPDILVTNYADQPKDLYWNRGQEGFTDLAYASRITKSELPYVAWGAGLVDFDNDGLPDAAIANGHIYPEVNTLADESHYDEPLLIFRNNGDRTFEDVSAASGVNSEAMHSRRGIAFGDINNDGAMDMVVFNVGAPPSLFLNDTRNTNHRVLLQLEGTRSNREAVGARVILTTASRKQMQEVKAGNSYLSTSDPRLHFGLGKDAVIQSLDIRWPSGAVDTLKDVSSDAIYTIIEGKGIAKRIKLAPPQ